MKLDDGNDIYEELEQRMKIPIDVYIYIYIYHVLSYVAIGRFDCRNVSARHSVIIV